MTFMKGKEMSLLEHITELRRRLVITFFFFVLFVAAGFFGEAAHNLPAADG